MRRVALRIQNGSETGRVLWVRSGQMVEVGSSDTVDFAVTSDEQIAPLHFEVRHNRLGCFVEVLDESAIFTVNDKRVQRKRLHNGDVLQAGQTRFLADIEGEPVGNGRSVQPASPYDTVKAGQPAATQSASAEQAPASDIVVNEPQLTDMAEYSSQLLAANVWLSQPIDAGSYTIERLVHQLPAERSMYCVLSETLIDDTGEEIESAEIDENRILVRITDRQWLANMLMHSGLSDAIVLVSGSDFASLLKSIRMETFSFGMPSVFSTQVAVGTQGMVDSLMKDKDAVFIADESAGWQMFSTGDIVQGWADLGFSDAPLIID